MKNGRLTLTQVRTQVQALRKQADDILNKAIEQEMWDLFYAHPKIETILKCMGSVVIYDKDGSFGDPRDKNDYRPAPQWAVKLHELADLDIENYSLTGHPLKIMRGTNGQGISTRDW